MFALDVCIQGDLGWRLQGKQNPKNWPKGSIRPRRSLGSIPRDLFDLDPPSEATLNAEIQGKYVGSVHYSNNELNNVLLSLSLSLDQGFDEML